jgi:VanZ family protein
MPDTGVSNLWFDFPIPLDKLAHFIMYSVLVFLMLHASKEVKNNIDLSNKTLLFIVLGVLLYGFLLEVLQSTKLIGRNASFTDMLANIIGIFVGILLYFVLTKKFKFLR